MKVSELKQLFEDIASQEVKNNILSESEEVYHIKCDGEPIASFKTKEEAEEALPDYKSKNKGELIIEKGIYESYSDMIDKLDEMGQELEEKENTNMETNESVDWFGGNSHEYYDEVIEEVKAKVDEWLNSGKIDEQEHYEMYFRIDSSDYEWNYDRGGDKVKYILIQLAKECAPHLLKKKKKETENMENQEPMEGNEFTMALKSAKDAGEKTFTVDGKEYDVEESWNKEMNESDCFECMDSINESEMCSECGGELNEEGMCNECGGMVNETKKKVLRLTETQMIEMIKKIVSESVPGVTVTKKAQDQSKKDNESNAKEVGNKIKKATKMEGGTNPEFPNQNGGEKEAIHNTEEENEYVQDNRGGTALNLDYDSEPSEKFKDRLKKAIEGDSTMGNSQDAANVVKSDLGKNIIKQAERKAKKEKEAPMYNKDVQPVKEVNESKVNLSSLLNEEMNKMKKIATYNKKTQ